MTVNASAQAGKSSSRRYPRYPIDTRLTIDVFRNGETASFWGRSNEVGMDGIGGTLTGELEPGEVVSMQITLPLATYPLKLRAIVRYRAGLRHGFEFLTLTAEQRTTITRVCEMLAAGK